MPLNKLALIRYKTIDACLCNRARKWTLDQLVDKVSEVLYDCEGIRDGVSKRTIQLDIQNMRSDKLGYNAPIVVKNRKYYTYEDPQFTITRSRLSQADVRNLSHVVGVLRQMNGFGHLGEMTEMITRLEENLHRNNPGGRPAIQFESNEMLRGLPWLDPIYQAIVNQKPLLISYKSFRAREEHQAIYYPYLLKEYRNRWFVVVHKKQSASALLNLALDRIVQVHTLNAEPWVAYEGVPLEEYYEHTIGVTRGANERPRTVVLAFDPDTAPYVLTKPLHPSQKILKEEKNWIHISIEVTINFELEREILGFGEQVKVLAPQKLVQRIAERVQKLKRHYPFSDDDGALGATGFIF